MMSLHTNNHFAKKRGIGKNLLFIVRTAMLQEQVDMVTSDFNGAAWRRQPGRDLRPISIMEEAFANTCLPFPPGPHTFVGIREALPGEWSDVCGFFKPPGSENEWQTSMHGAFTIPSTCWASGTQIKAAITTREKGNAFHGWVVKPWLAGIFMSMYNHIVWRENGNTEECEQNSLQVSKYARRYYRGPRGKPPAARFPGRNS